MIVMNIMRRLLLKNEEVFLAYIGYLKNSLIDTLWLRSQIVTADYIEALTVNFKQGTIGGFQIYQNYLQSITGNSKYILQPGSYMAFVNDNAGLWAGIGENVYSGIMGGARALARFEINNASSYFGNINYALMVGAKGSLYENHAIAITSGWISGLSIKIRRTAINETLSMNDVYIACYNSSNISLSLPAIPEPGKIYFIRRCSSGGVTISGNGHSILQSNSVTSSIIQGTTSVMLVWDGQIWQYGLIS